MKIDVNDLDALDDLLRELVARLDGPIILVTFGENGEYTQVHAGLPTQDRSTFFTQAIHAITETRDDHLALLRERIEPKPKLH